MTTLSSVSSHSPRAREASHPGSSTSEAIETTPEECIHELLETVLAPEIDQLELTASLHSIEARRALSLYISQIAQEIHRTTKPRAGGSTQEERMVVRAQKLLACIGSPHIAPIDVPTVMHGRFKYPKSSVGALKDIAIEHMMQGYGDTMDEQWNNVLQPFVEPPAPWEAYCQGSQELDVVDDCKRIYTRNKAMISQAIVGTTCSWVDTLLRQINTIQLASEWNERGSGPGGRKWKASFYRWAYIQCHPDVFEGLVVAQSMAALLREEHKASFAAFKRSYERPVHARNTLLKVYHAFGPSVLLDPLWDVDTPRMARFSNLLVQIKLRVPRDADKEDMSILDRLLPTHRKVLLLVVRNIASVAVETHVQRFLDRNL